MPYFLWPAALVAPPAAHSCCSLLALRTVGRKIAGARTSRGDVSDPNVVPESACGNALRRCTDPASAIASTGRAAGCDGGA
jgi:hypothetical protein